MEEVSLIQLLKLLKDLLPPEVYANIMKVILQMMESTDRIAIGQLKRILLEWAEKNYPEYQKLIRLIVDKILPRLSGSSSVTLAELASILGLAALAPALLVGAGLALPASKMGELGWDWSGWWRDPCDELFSEIADLFAQHQANRGNYPAGMTRRKVMDLLNEVGHMLTLVGKFLKDCPEHKRRKTLDYILKKLEGYRDEYLAYL